jgi:serine protease
VATPHASGVAALVWSHFDSLTATEIRSVLEYTATDLGNPGKDIFYGNGLIDAKAAFDFLASGKITSPTSAPTPFSGCRNEKKRFVFIFASFLQLTLMCSLFLFN